MTAIIKETLIASVLVIGFLFMLMPHTADSSELLFILVGNAVILCRVINKLITLRPFRNWS